MPKSKHNSTCCQNGVPLEEGDDRCLHHRKCGPTRHVPVKAVCKCVFVDLHAFTSYYQLDIQFKYNRDN